MTQISLGEPLKEVYLLDTPGGMHYCPKWLKHYRNSDDISLPKPRRRIVKVDLVDFEDATKSKKKLVVPVVHAMVAGPESVFVVYIILTPDPKTFAGVISINQYRKLPEMEIEGI